MDIKLGKNIISPARPFLKWVGGKRSVLAEIVSRMQSDFKENYFEPFIGGGSVFFALQPKNAFLSDINFHLIVTYKSIRDQLDDLIQELKQHKKKHSPEYYREMRRKLNTEENPVKIASAVLYLNKTCFNGLYRVNQKGEFNVPMGSYQNPAILDEENLRNCSEVLQGTEIYQQDFAKLKPVKNAWYYLDPPYHKTYSQYNGSKFGVSEHEQLAVFCDAIDRKGSYFLLSNSDTELIRTLYRKYHIEIITSSRSVSCKADQRGKEKELVIRNYEWDSSSKKRVFAWDSG